LYSTYSVGAGQAAHQERDFNLPLPIMNPITSTIKTKSTSGNAVAMLPVKATETVHTEGSTNPFED
jgi:hypothetical protein